MTIQEGSDYNRCWLRGLSTLVVRKACLTIVARHTMVRRCVQSWLCTTRSNLCADEKEVSPQITAANDECLSSLDESWFCLQVMTRAEAVACSFTSHSAQLIGIIHITWMPAVHIHHD
eukprot:jgi/Ulvmu1/2243/UM013_0090.1